jgi:two-component system, OmpR family, Ni(II)-sensor and/or redox sensor kinase NrsS
MPDMNDYSLFRRSRLQLAFWYAGAMGTILSIFCFGIYRATIESNWATMGRELESISGTLHDSIEPLLPVEKTPTKVLQQIFPDLCSIDKPCKATPTTIQRHTMGISDRNIYYIRLLDDRGKLLAFSPNQPLAVPRFSNLTPWQTFQTTNGTRYRQFTTILHNTSSHDSAAHSHNSWGYLQIGRTLESFDGELARIRWILTIGFSITLVSVAASSWWLAGLAMQPIYRSYQQQQQFTADAAHELRSPLASLLATVEAILRLPLAEISNTSLMLQTVERQGRRLSHLITDLLLLSSLERDIEEKSFSSCYLNDIISDLTEEFSELATAAGISLTSCIPEDEIYILGCESQLYRLVSNLIANSIQYTPAGGVVVVTLTSADRAVSIEVRDTGIGIDPAEQSRIFDRFYRINSDRSRKTGGIGLGLAICQAIVQLHKGQLSVKSNRDLGSVFTIRLPLILMDGSLHRRRSILSRYR